MSVKKTSFSKKSFVSLDVKAMSAIVGGGDPFDPNFSEKRRLETPKEEQTRLSFRPSFIG